MKKTLLMILAVAAATIVAANSSDAATISASYGWEDGSGTVLGSFGNLSSATNVASGDEYIDNSLATSGVTPNSGSRMLQLEENPHSGTPQAYIGYIENLQAGDTVTASFFGFDSTANSPSMRIWGHWADNGDVGSYNGSAGGNNTYTGDGSIGWFEVDHTWTSTGQEALVIEARLYSTPSSGGGPTTFFVDDLSISVESASGAATITAPGSAVPEPGALAALASLGLFGAGFASRRRRRA